MGLRNHRQNSRLRLLILIFAALSTRSLLSKGYEAAEAFCGLSSRNLNGLKVSVSPSISSRLVVRGRKPREIDKEDMDNILDELEGLATKRDEEDPFIQEEDPLQGLKETLGNWLVADVFFVLFLFAWFLLGTALNYGANYDGLIQLFIKYWDPYFQSILGVLFAGRLGVYLFQEVTKKRDWDD
eukprot:TRINITY_DN28305_c0_g1_i2.p1 TRINITY_DN28305_c0_g1~~TRINITY_DN28305_c0_g1_i2.p1  ORF type:complete len:184 (-),score=28.03 TRINITY_DN28305_c0_g1_i2:284-835(-)